MAKNEQADALLALVAQYPGENTRVYADQLGTPVIVVSRLMYRLRLTHRVVRGTGDKLTGGKRTPFTYWPAPEPQDVKLPFRSSLRWRTLVALRDMPDMCAQQLAKEMGEQPRRAGSAVSGLMGLGLVEKHPDDIHKARNFRVRMQGHVAQHLEGVPAGRLRQPPLTPTPTQPWTMSPTPPAPSLGAIAVLSRTRDMHLAKAAALEAAIKVLKAEGREVSDE